MNPATDKPTLFLPPKRPREFSFEDNVIAMTRDILHKQVLSPLLSWVWANVLIYMEPLTRVLYHGSLTKIRQPEYSNTRSFRTCFFYRLSFNRVSSSCCKIRQQGKESYFSPLNMNKVSLDTKIEGYALTSVCSSLNGLHCFPLL
jgi:hypothetical protein